MPSVKGDFMRHAVFSLDPNVPKRCQQTSTTLYRHPTAA
jgi:hypothetical protein